MMRREAQGIPVAPRSSCDEHGRLTAHHLAGFAPAGLIWRRSDATREASH
jgi:hypothetical protein